MINPQAPFSQNFDNPHSIFCTVVVRGDVKMCELLLQKGADPFMTIRGFDSIDAIFNQDAWKE